MNTSREGSSRGGGERGVDGVLSPPLLPPPFSLALVRRDQDKSFWTRSDELDCCEEAKNKWERGHCVSQKGCSVCSRVFSAPG